MGQERSRDHGRSPDGSPQISSFGILQSDANSLKEPRTTDVRCSLYLSPFLATGCFACHNARLGSVGLNLETCATPESAIKDKEKWEQILQNLQSGEMRPPGARRPTPAEVDAVTSWIEGEFNRADSTIKPAAGRVTARRLDRADYNNTVHDLLGVDFQPAGDFPQDDSGYGRSLDWGKCSFSQPSS